jgi:hypothetical protein
MNPYPKEYMNRIVRVACIGITLLGVAGGGNAQELLTFDDLATVSPAPGVPSQGVIPDGYGGLDWLNFGVVDGLEVDPTYGYYTGVVSSANVAVNEFSSPASIVISSGLFDLDSAYLTAGLNDGRPLDVQVQGYLGTTMLYNNTYTVNNSGPTLINFNYIGVNTVTFISSPVERSATPFAMDNLTVTVPESSSLAMMLLGAALSGFVMKLRKPYNKRA